MLSYFWLGLSRDGNNSVLLIDNECLVYETTFTDLKTIKIALALRIREKHYATKASVFSGEVVLWVVLLEEKKNLFIWRNTLMRIGTTSALRACLTEKCGYNSNGFRVFSCLAS